MRNAWVKSLRRHSTWHWWSFLLIGGLPDTRCCQVAHRQGCFLRLVKTRGDKGKHTLHLPKPIQNTPSGSLSLTFWSWPARCFDIFKLIKSPSYAEPFVPHTGARLRHDPMCKDTIPANVKSRNWTCHLATMFEQDFVQCVKCFCWHSCNFHIFSSILMWAALKDFRTASPYWAEMCFVAKLLVICATPQLIGKLCEDTTTKCEYQQQIGNAPSKTSKCWEYK